MLKKSCSVFAVMSVFVAAVVAVPLPEKSSEPRSAAPVERDTESSRLQRYGEIGLKPQKVVRYQPVECVHPDSAPYLPRQVLEGSGLIPGSGAQTTQGGVTGDSEAAPNAMMGGAVVGGDSNLLAAGAMGNVATHTANGVGTSAGGGMTEGATGTAEASTAMVSTAGQSGVEGATAVGGTMHAVAAPAGVAAGGAAPGGQLAWNGASQTGAGDAAIGAPSATTESAPVTQSAPAMESRQMTIGTEQGATAATGGDAMSTMGVTSSVSATTDGAMNGAGVGGQGGDAGNMAGVSVNAVSGAEGDSTAAGASNGGAINSGAPVAAGGVAPVVSADVGQTGLIGASGPAMVPV